MSQLPINKKKTATIIKMWLEEIANIKPMNSEIIHISFGKICDEFDLDEDETREFIKESFPKDRSTTNE